MSYNWSNADIRNHTGNFHISDLFGKTCVEALPILRSALEKLEPYKLDKETIAQREATYGQNYYWGVDENSKLLPVELRLECFQNILTHLETSIETHPDAWVIGEDKYVYLDGQRIKPEEEPDY